VNGTFVCSLTGCLSGEKRVKGSEQRATTPRACTDQQAEANHGGSAAVQPVVVLVSQGTDGGLSLGPGPFAAALEFATGRTAEVSSRDGGIFWTWKAGPSEGEGLLPVSLTQCVGSLLQAYCTQQTADSTLLSTLQ